MRLSFASSFDASPPRFEHVDLSGVYTLKLRGHVPLQGKATLFEKTKLLIKVVKRMVILCAPSWECCCCWASWRALAAITYQSPRIKAPAGMADKTSEKAPRHKAFERFARYADALCSSEKQISGIAKSWVDVFQGWATWVTPTRTLR